MHIKTDFYLGFWHGSVLDYFTDIEKSAGECPTIEYMSALNNTIGRSRESSLIMISAVIKGIMALYQASIRS